MKKYFSIPLNYREGTFSTEKIEDFSGESIDIEYLGALKRYIVPKYKVNALICSDSLNYNPVFNVTYDGNGIIKYIELHRNKGTELRYINFYDPEHAKEIFYKYSCYWGDWISEKIIERKEKISRLFIDYIYEYD
nr:hypothetical protein [Ruminococcus sp.]